MITLTSFEDFQKFISENTFAAVMFTSPDCSVCDPVKTSLGQLKERSLMHLTLGEVDISKVPMAAGQYSIFTLPGLLVFANGKEAIREARFFHFDQLEKQLIRLQDMLFA